VREWGESGKGMTKLTGRERNKFSVMARGVEGPTTRGCLDLKGMFNSSGGKKVADREVLPSEKRRRGSKSNMLKGPRRKLLKKTHCLKAREFASAVGVKQDRTSNWNAAVKRDSYSESREKEIDRKGRGNQSRLRGN